MPKQNVCSRGVVRLVLHIIGSGVTTDLSQSEILAEEGPPTNTQ